MRALFISKNLIGDALWVTPVLKEWHEKHPEYEIDVLTLNDFIADIYRRVGFPVNVIFDAQEKDYDFVHTFDIGKAFDMGNRLQIHAVEAYGKCLFGEEHLAESLKPVYVTEEEEHEKDLLLISPFSRSCSSNEKGKPPNKMLPWPHWLQIVTLLRAYGKVGVLGGPDDRCPLPISDDEYFTGLPLNYVALLLRDAKLLVTIDNGMAHLASSQDTQTVELYPSCLGVHWAAPLGNKNLYLIHMNPADISVGQAVYAVRQGIDALLLSTRRESNEKD